MIGHHEFKESLACAQNFLGIGDNFHPRFDRADAGGGQNACAGIHHTKPANADGSLVLKMAKSWDGDAVHPRGVEDGCVGGHSDGPAVESDVDHSGRCEGGCHFKVNSNQLSVFSRRRKYSFLFCLRLNFVALPF